MHRLFQRYPPENIRIVGPEADAKSGPVAFRHHVVRMPWRRLEGSRFNKLHRTLRCFGLVPRFPVRNVDALLGDFRPDVVLTVMPENWKHYIGVDFRNLNRDIRRIAESPALLEDVAAQGRRWAIENYAPRKVAERLIDHLGINK